ncbi:UDP-glucose dehydrogenase family protein [Lutibaculum baratangense]|uniref:UDP-glucose 6-dehydrogenase n=1 Tax=Lutibaculum baratangense AMV1 TaxID=631454 RepID=V4RHE6_9HYPH|nr:UDP-glucose/GDP-mannose dehydrogenase family protein [Lutibaculum baratangense]ESR22700.1 UDP-glucose dehydrogenase [Lutibaculum baratangense AMV1]
MKIAMIGTGYVGLVSGACFADFGHEVVCVDKDELKIKRLLKNEIPIYEPGLDVLVAGNQTVGRLSFTTDLPSAVKGADAVFIAVGTPSRRGDGHADLSYVYAAAEEVAKAADGYVVVVTKSTVPVCTGDEVERIVREARPDLKIDVASNPEFLREGSAIEDFKRPDRVVIGVENEKAREVMRLLYRPLFINETPLLFTRRRTAELTKYAANAFLATKISFINEIADLCEKTGADVQDVARGIGLDRRIGSKFLHAGPGFGGSCFPKDTLALVRTAEQFEAPTRIVEAVMQVNDARKGRMADRIIEACGGSLQGRTVAVLGVAFKPQTDDMREAPSIDIVGRLKAAGATVKAYDPAAMGEAKKIDAFAGVVWCNSSYEAMAGADALAILTEWNEFRALDLGRVRRLLTAPVIVDLRNIYTLEEMREKGFTYVSVGRPAVAGEVVEVAPPLERATEQG